MCNVENKKSTIPDIFHEDWIYAIWIIAFALSNGHLTALIFIIVPERLKKLGHSKSAVSSGSYVLFMTYAAGLVAGSAAAFAVKYTVTN